jgi:hypothetical protein
MVAAIALIAQPGDIRVVQRTAQELVIYQPPYTSLGVILLIGGIIALASAFSAMFLLKGRGPSFLRYVGFAGALVFLFFGVRNLTSERYIELSKGRGTLEVRKRRFFVTLSDETIPLANIRRAVVVSGRRSTTLAVLLNSGAEVNLTDRTAQQGCYAAEDAINSFLGSGK